MPRRSPDSRPNLLLITTDQQSANAMGSAGNPDLHTPAMDQLASQGVRFTRAYSPNPICVPARTSYMTGTYSHENGVFGNEGPESGELSVPFLISWPGHTKGNTVNSSHLVQVGLDLFPTLFDFAQVETPPSLHGHSMGAVAMGSSDQPHPRRYIVAQNQPARNPAEFPRQPQGRMVRSTTHKYVCFSHSEPREQLFDMENDPGELQDLKLDPDAQQILHSHRAHLREHCETTADSFLQNLQNT